MKKAIKINLSGIIFHIDEDAYERLKQYLDAISRHFSNKEEGKEIMNDIEARIAELFQEKREKDEEAINLNLVNQVIEIMGDPEDYVDATEETSTGSSNKTHSTFTGNGSRKLYRDPENSVVAGVCGGLGAYFGMDAIIFRILFIVFFFMGFSSLIVYIILWIVLPLALTAAQKLEMRGQPVNVSNIEKKVREEYEATKENVKAAANSESVQRTKKAASNFFSDLGKILLVFIKVILILIGTAFILCGIAIIISLITGTFVGLHVFPFGDYNFTLSDLLTPFSDPVNVTLIIVALTFLILIPVIAMIYGIIKLIFNIKSHNRSLTIGATTLWIVSLLMIIGIFAFETSNYSKSGTSTLERIIETDSDTIIVTINEGQKKEFEHDLVFDFDLDLGSEWYLTEDLDRIYGQVGLDIEQSSDTRYHLEVEKRSKGKNWDKADENAAKINYNFRVQKNTLILDPYFYIEGDDKWRFPNTDLTLKVPEGKVVILENDCREIMEDVYNVDHISDWKMAGKSWRMTERGLKLIEVE